MTKNEFEVMNTIMRLIWGEAYAAGMHGIDAPDMEAPIKEQWKENHRHRDENIQRLIEAAGLKIDS